LGDLEHKGGAQEEHQKSCEFVHVIGGFWIFRMGMIIIFEEIMGVYIASRLPPKTKKRIQLEKFAKLKIVERWMSNGKDLNRRESFDKS